MDAKSGKATRQIKRRKQKILNRVNSKDLMKSMIIYVAAGLCQGPCVHMDLLMHGREWNRKHWKQQLTHVSKIGQNTTFTNPSTFCCRNFHHQSESKHYRCMKLLYRKCHNMIRSILCCRDHKTIRFKTFHHLSDGGMLYARLLTPKGKCADSRPTWIRLMMRISLLLFITRKYLGAKDLIAFKSWTNLICSLEAAKRNIFRDSIAQRMKEERYFLCMALGCSHLYDNLNDIYLKIYYRWLRIILLFRKVLNNVINNNTLNTCAGKKHFGDDYTFDHNFNCILSDVRGKFKIEIFSQVKLKDFKYVLRGMDKFEIQKKEDDIINVFLKKHNKGNHFQHTPHTLNVYPVSNDPNFAHILALRFKDFHKESHRLQTFRKFPPTYAISPVLLANEGFVYDPEPDFKDKVKCIFCSKSYTGWQCGDNVNQIHRNISEGCPMAWGKYCRNIPLRVNNENSVFVNGSDTTQETPQAGERLNSTSHHDQLTTENGLPRSTAAPTILATSNTVDSNVGTSTRERSTQARSDDRSSTSQSSSQNSIHLTRSARQAFDIFEATQGNGLLRSTAAPITLATPNTVDSNIGNSTSRESSTPARFLDRSNRPQSSVQVSSHRTRNARLAFDIVEVTEGNGLLRSTAAPTTLETPNTVDSNVGNSTRESSTPARSLDRSNRPQSSVQVSSHPTRNARLALDNFEVAEGIFECFYCGGQHRVSGNVGNIWIEHASLFPDCGYTRMRRGNNFVDAVLELLPNDHEITEAVVNEHMNLPIALGAYAAAPNRHQSSLENFRPQESLTDLMEEHMRLHWRITCQKCLLNMIEVVMIPCECLVTCVECSITLTHCYKCHREVEGFARAFFS